MRNLSSTTREAGTSDIASTFVELTSESARRMASAVQSNRTLAGAWVDLLRTAAALPVAMLSSGDRSIGAVLSGCGCEIPETQCPPYFVCEVMWEGTPNESVKATIGLTNTRTVPQSFTLAATTFRGPGGDTTAAPNVSPGNVTLAAGESTTVTLHFTVPPTVVAGETYDAQVRITGLYEQGVRLRLFAKRVPHCDVRQGEIPTHLRAHRWYQHFQCEERCFEPAKSIVIG